MFKELISISEAEQVYNVPASSSAFCKSSSRVGLMSFSNSSVARWTGNPDTPCRLPVQIQADVRAGALSSCCDVH